MVQYGGNFTEAVILGYFQHGDLEMIWWRFLVDFGDDLVMIWWYFGGNSTALHQYLSGFGADKPLSNHPQASPSLLQDSNHILVL